MLTAIELENFKAFGEHTRIELAPITLVFGDNSAGKSSILQALNLLKQTRESRDSGALILPRSEDGIVELGGFQELVFDHDLNRDVSIVHPEQPGKYVLGVECDGATYHSSATARDRDRLRQSVLEGLGWHIHRIWSTDWVRDRQRQIQRVREAFEKALVSPGGVNHVQQTNSSAIDERPRIRQKQSFGDLYGKFGYYGDISEVDARVIEKAITSMLGMYGATQKSELLKCVSQSLGFSRLGPRIRSAIEGTLNKLASSGVIAARDDDVFSLPEG